MFTQETLERIYRTTWAAADDAFQAKDCAVPAIDVTILDAGDEQVFQGSFTNALRARKS